METPPLIEEFVLKLSVPNPLYSVPERVPWIMMAPETESQPSPGGNDANDVRALAVYA
jgi:hypothetical protein